MRTTWYAQRCLGLVLAFSLFSSLQCMAVEKGDTAPDFKLPSLLQNKFISLSDYRGKVVFLDFWSAWCVPCRDSVPQLASMRAKLSDQSFELVSVDVDIEPEDARKFLLLRGITANLSHPIVMDPQANLARLYRVSSLPASYLIDQRGIVREVHAGLAVEDIEGIEKSIRKLINANVNG